MSAEEDIQRSRDRAARLLAGTELSSLEGLDKWKLYEKADLAYGCFSYDNITPEESRRYTADTLLAIGFPPDYLERTLDYAQLEVGDLSARSAIRIQFEDGFSKEELEARANSWLEIDSPREERARRKADFDQAVARWDEVMSGRLINPSPSSTPKLFDFDLTKGQLDARFTRPLPPVQYAIERLLPLKAPIVFSGLGGSQKTRALILMAICVALGIDCLGRRTTPGCVLLILAEDSQDETDRRVAACVAQLQLTPEQVQLINERLVIFNARGENIQFTSLRHGAITRTGLPDTIITRCHELGARTGLAVKLIGIDNYGITAGGQINSNEDATCYFREITKIAEETNAAVVVVAHHRKSSMNEEQSAAATMGASSIVTSARVAIQSTGMSKDEAKRFGISEGERRNYTRLSVQKANSVACGDVCWLRSIYHPQLDTVALEQADLKPITPAGEKKVAVAQESIWTLVQDCPGKFSVSDFSQRYSSQLKLGREKIRIAILDMVAEGFLRLRAPSDAERETYDLTHRVKEVLVVGSTLRSSEYQSPKDLNFDEATK